jgi:hypothetical protein
MARQLLMRRSHRIQIVSVGIDFGKTTFHLVAQTCLLTLSFFLAVGRRSIHIRPSGSRLIVGECVGDVSTVESETGEGPTKGVFSELHRF